MVIGGGIGGLAAAIALRSVGVDAHVYEQASEPTEIGAGLSVWSNGSKALDLLGLGDSWGAAATALARAETRTPSGNVVGRLDVTKLNRETGHPTVAAHRGELFRLLLQALPDKAIHTDKRSRAFREEGERVVVSFTDESEASGTFLVGADGVASPTRAQLFPQRCLTYAGYGTWRGVVDLDAGANWPTRSLVRTVGRGEYFGIGELSPQRYLWYATKNRREGEPEPDGRKATLMRHFGSWHHPIADLVTATPENGIYLHPIYKMTPQSQWSKGRATLLGDAAHPIEPSLGMGASLALEDAVVLARCVDRESNVEKALQRYGEARRSRVRRMVRASALLARSEQVESRFACALRDLSSRFTPEPLVRAMWRPMASFSRL